VNVEARSAGPSGEGSAPGRLDVLGGVADYSGSLVLQMPIALATTVSITSRDEPGLSFTSGDHPPVTIPQPPAELLEAAAGSGPVRDWLDRCRVARWVRYPLGCLVLFCQACRWRPAAGLAFSIRSTVPASMGVSSSAALEVATLRALERLAEKSFTGTALAGLAQRAENEIVGAACGLMDQLAVAHGRCGELLPILCRPDVLHESVRLPEGAIVVGWPSGVRHAVADAPYATARAAAFMGRRIIERALGTPLAYLSEVDPTTLAALDHHLLPESMVGEAFLAEYGSVDDALSRIEPGRRYPVRAAVSFAVGEHARSGVAMQVLREARSASRRDALAAVGDLMLRSHAGYGEIGLGCAETDAMVEAVCERGVDRGFYGARVSGGGSGGTVVVLLEEASRPVLDDLVARVTPQAGPIAGGLRILR
jgi:galactokinase